ncbi:MAG: bifunctional 4-hydroxy-3-methylbut-2-enyl diphosphate reductase/30S ribosomal protein S1 [Eubacteriales bacterium]|nr:bifunctional 4-hydroxy-3-methylbut-2-enyl diphosphate reductase/30S ribosomal protein S1 [Eubacteriales bacterium]MDD4511664.1 bifunctional 4-hydroxy-3-methylbut-2-enyl diphosphate reductase/30S ribosomal protein S1 [Eubacteriales bacterium]
MPVTVAEYAGFCVGVRKAVETALSYAQGDDKTVTWGELIHNPAVIARLDALGVRKVDDISKVGGKRVIIRSHGVTEATERALYENAGEVVDCTCPFVRNVHKIVRKQSEGGKPVIIIGEREHPEVQGTAGWCLGAVYYAGSADEAEALPELDEAAAVAQTTFRPETYEEIIEILRKKVKRLSERDTICISTAQRQKEAAALAKRSDRMIVVGGRNSSNSRKLRDTCLRFCGQTILVESAAEIPSGFADNKTHQIGIAAGASTPDWSLKEVVTRMIDKEQLSQGTVAEEDASFLADMEKTLVKIRPGQTVTGKVVQITDDEICVNIGYKADGLMKRSDMSQKDVKLDDEIEVEVVKVNDGDGNVVVSQRNLVNQKAWDALMAKYEAGEYVDATGKEAVKGGLLCDLGGVRAFVPASQLSSRFVEKISEFVGQPMQLKIIEVDKAKKRVVASRKAVLAAESAQKKDAVWATLTEGEVVKGIVRRLTDFGAFVDLGGVDGLIHIRDLSWGQVKHPLDVVEPNQEVEVKVLSLDRERERIQLGLKQLQPKPWDTAADRYPVGSIIEGKVVRITTFGAFVELERGLDGLVHISQCSLSRIAKVEDAVKVGDVVRVKVLSVDPAAQRISLSIKEVLEDEAMNVSEELPGVDEFSTDAAEETPVAADAQEASETPAE